VKVRLAYGKRGLDLSLPDNLNADVVRPKHVEAFADQAGAVRDGLRHPIGSRPLREWVKPSDTVGIVCNDITRPTPYQTILPVLLDELSHVPDEAVVLLIATGTHRANTPDELKAMLGVRLVDRFRIVQNDARDRDSHALAGTTADGNEIRLHKEYLCCDVRILTGFIEPHFFAGFSGGGKACMPGLALLETIVSNHSARNMDHPRATWGITHGNPVWEEIREAARMTPAFLLNVALNREKQITGVFAGDPEPAHEQGCAFVRRHAMVPVNAPYDIVITSNSGYPLDLNLYQAVKGMSAAAQVVKNGGTIIVAADCWDGIPDHGAYKSLLLEADRPGSLLERLRAGAYHGQDSWQAHIHASICQKADVYLFSHNLTDEEIQRAMLQPCRDIAKTVNGLLEFYGPEASICVLPEGPQTIPYVSGVRET
jgi:nickel-dependent lactate racemase